MKRPFYWQRVLQDQLGYELTSAAAGSFRGSLCTEAEFRQRCGKIMQRKGTSHPYKATGNLTPAEAARAFAEEIDKRRADYLEVIGGQGKRAPRKVCTIGEYKRACYGS